MSQQNNLKVLCLEHFVYDCNVYISHLIKDFTAFRYILVFRGVGTVSMYNRYHFI